MRNFHAVLLGEEGEESLLRQFERFCYQTEEALPEEGHLVDIGLDYGPDVGCCRWVLWFR